MTGRGSTPRGGPVNRTVLFRREQADIKDTWHVLGTARDREQRLRGHPTCSCRGILPRGAIPVPDRREDGPLYNIPMLTLYGVGFSGVALGIARACLDAFMQLAQTKSRAAAWARRACCATTR